MTLHRRRSGGIGRNRVNPIELCDEVSKPVIAVFLLFDREQPVKAGAQNIKITLGQQAHRNDTVLRQHTSPGWMIATGDSAISATLAFVLMDLGKRTAHTERRSQPIVAYPRRAPMTDPIKPTTETDKPNLSTEHQNEGDARRPSDTLNKGTLSTEGEEAPKRKSSLT